MEKKKLIFFDLDDTLLKRDKSVSSNTLKVLKLLKDKGHKIIIDTARNKRMTLPLTDLLEVNYTIINAGAYILDENHDIYRRLNRELVQMYDLDDKTTALIDGTSDEEVLHSLIEQHEKETGSVKAAAILKDWEHYKHCFKKIIPNDYLKMMSAIADGEKEGLGHDDAVMQAFKKMTA